MRKQFAIGACIAVGLLTGAQAAPVSAIAFDLTDVGTPGFASFYSSRGYEFQVTKAGLSASHLGVFDLGGDGLAESHLVGLWTVDGTLLASATVASGTTELLKDGFRYIDIPDVALAIGSYIVAAVYEANSGDKQVFANTLDFATASGITFVKARSGSCCIPVVLPFPEQSFDTGLGMFGGSIMVDDGRTAAPVPEPASHALALAALGALAWSRRRGVRALAARATR